MCLSYYFNKIYECSIFKNNSIKDEERFKLIKLILKNNLDKLNQDNNLQTSGCFDYLCFLSCSLLNNDLWKTEDEIQSMKKILIEKFSTQYKDILKDSNNELEKDIIQLIVNLLEKLTKEEMISFIVELKIIEQAKIQTSKTVTNQEDSTRANIIRPVENQ